VYIPPRRRMGSSSRSTGKIKPPRRRIWRRRRGTERSRAQGSTGRSREHGRWSMRSRDGTGRSEPCCPCRWIWRGSVGTEWSRTHRRRSMRRRSNARSRSRHGLVAAPWCCLAAALSPRQGPGGRVVTAAEDWEEQVPPMPCRHTEDREDAQSPLPRTGRTHGRRCLVTAPRTGEDVRSSLPRTRGRRRRGPIQDAHSPSKIAGSKEDL
jgi:hypothetical protein